MKKIMIVLGIALAATLSQGAAIQWKVQAGPAASRLLDYTGSAAFKGTAYLILTSDAATFTAQLAKDGTIGTTAIYGSASTFNAVTGGTTTTLTSDNTLNAVESSFSLLLVQNDGDKTYYKVSDAMTATPSTDLVNNPVLVQWTASTQINNNAWQSYTAVPEPTSGLLLLLGMAGLALKRKVV